MTFQEIVQRVSFNLGDPKFRRWSEDTVIQIVDRAHKRTCALVGSIQSSTAFPFIDGSPYYNFRKWVPNYFAMIGVYNWKTNTWIEFVSEKTLDNYRWDWERWEGEPTSTGIILDWNRVGIFPWSSNPVGTFILWYKAFPMDIEETGSPEFPTDFHHILVDSATSDLLMTDREFGKANIYYQKYQKEIPNLRREIDLIAKYDKNMVLEPYMVMPRYGTGNIGTMAFIDDITPDGIIDGVNPDFTLPKIPNPISSLALFKNGQLMERNIAYTLSGVVIHFNPPYIPQGDDILSAWFRIS